MFPPASFSQAMLIIGESDVRVTVCSRNLCARPWNIRKINIWAHQEISVSITYQNAHTLVKKTRKQFLQYKEIYFPMGTLKKSWMGIFTGKSITISET